MNILDFPFEERMLICDTPRTQGYVDEDGIRKSVYGPCGNVLKLRIYHTLQPLFHLGPGDASTTPVDYVVAVRETDLIEGGKLLAKQGACLTYGRRRKAWATHLQGRMYTYGPTREMAVSFLHCKRCENRWHKKRFKAVNL